MDAYLGYARHEPAGRDGGNSRSGYRGKNVLTDIGPVEIGVPRDRDSSFEPQIVANRQRRLTGVDDLGSVVTRRTNQAICRGVGRCEDRVTAVRLAAPVMLAAMS